MRIACVAFTPFLNIFNMLYTYSGLTLTCLAHINTTVDFCRLQYSVNHAASINISLL